MGASDLTTRAKSLVDNAPITMCVCDSGCATSFISFSIGGTGRKNGDDGGESAIIRILDNGEGRAGLYACFR